MPTPDQSFNQWKEEMRQDALDKELKRVKLFSTKQSEIIQRQRRTLLFLSIFIMALFSLLIFNGFLNWPSEQGSKFIAQESLFQPDAPPVKPQEPTATQTSLVNTPLQILKPNRDTLCIQIPNDGILFSVQIGAYTAFDLKRFNSNLVSIHQDTYQGINQLSLGVFPHYPIAVKFLEIVKKIGFKDAFVMATRYGQRIKLQEALMRCQKQNRPSPENSNIISQLKN